jgi:ADP-heptose:LPS heptosyltransferase
MRLQSKLLLDKIFGIPTVFLLSLIGKSSRYFSNDKKRKLRPIRRIAVCKFLGMGSIIQSTPLLLTLRKNYESAEIVYITSSINYGLINTFPFVKKIFVVNHDNLIKLFTSVFKLLILVLKNKIDLLIDLEVHSFFSTIISAISFAPRKIGFYKKEEWMKHNIYTKMIYYNIKAPMVNVYLQAARLASCNKLIEKLYTFDSLGTESINSLDIKLKEIGTEINSNYVVVNPNASELRIERRWHYKNYVEIINKILEDYPEKIIVLIGAKNEKWFVENLYSEIRDDLLDRVFDTSGKLSIEELILLIRNCTLMITNDSGPMHMAFAMNKKTVALFGPCSPQQYETQSNVSFIYVNLYCSPCVHQFTISPCNGDNQCMKLLTVSKVYEAVQNMINCKMLAQPEFEHNDIIYKDIGKDLPFGILKRE